jgi:hypothetical protein
MTIPVSRRNATGGLLCALVAGCAPKGPAVNVLPQPGSAEPPRPPEPPPPPILSFDEAVTNTARSVLATAPAPQLTPATLVIDPLVDGMTGYQSSATQGIQDHILQLARNEFPQYAVRGITAQSLQQQPRFMIGTFTPINAQLQPAGQRESYWFCLVMGDLKTGRIVAKSVARVRLQDVDATPVATFSDSPVWTEDPSIQAYVTTCKASKVGDPIRPEYLDGLLAAALVNEAGDAYDEKRYAEALDLYRTALKAPAGEQLRVYNGIYLSLTRLGRASESATAFGELVEFGLRRKRLAVKFLFRPASVRLEGDGGLSGNYDMWIQQIAARAVSSQACLEVTGHTSPTGPAALNDRLSLMRAEYIQMRLQTDQASLAKRTLAAGVGSRENLIGTGKDDASDMLDRRVEIKPIEPCTEGSHA